MAAIAWTFRIVAATNRSLASLVEQRLFRSDLFYRLSGVDIRVPTLRERRSTPRARPALSPAATRPPGRCACRRKASQA